MLREAISVKIILVVLAAFLLFSEPLHAAKSKRDYALSEREAVCKAQARMQHPGVRFIKRREYVNRCMGRAKPHKNIAPRKVHARTSHVAFRSAHRALSIRFPEDFHARDVLKCT